MTVKMKSIIVGLLFASGASGVVFCQDSAWRKALEVGDRTVRTTAGS